MGNGFALDDWMKGGPALPGGPLKSKPTGLNADAFSPAGFFVVPVRGIPRTRRPAGALTEESS